MTEQNPETVGVFIGFTTTDLMLILDSLEWFAAGQPDKEGNYRTDVDGYAQFDANVIRDQLPEGWNVPKADGILNNDIHFVFIGTEPEVVHHPWMQFLIDEVFNAEVEAENAGQ